MTSIVYICHPALLHRLLLLTLVVVGDATSAQVVQDKTTITGEAQNIIFLKVKEQKRKFSANEATRSAYLHFWCLWMLLAAHPGHLYRDMRRDLHCLMTFRFFPNSMSCPAAAKFVANTMLHERNRICTLKSI